MHWSRKEKHWTHFVEYKICFHEFLKKAYRIIVTAENSQLSRRRMKRTSHG